MTNRTATLKQSAAISSTIAASSSAGVNYQNNDDSETGVSKSRPGKF